MAEYVAKRNPDRCPTHPGVVLAEAIEAAGISKSEVARLISVGRVHIHSIISGKAPVTPETAVKLGKLFGNGAALWINMQTAYDTWQAARRVDVTVIPTIQAQITERSA